MGNDAARIRELCRERLGQEPDAIAAIEAGLGSRRFFRVDLAQPPHSLIARFEAEEDPAGRPPGVPPEPRLEPIRSLLEGAGLPVPRCYGATDDGDLMLLGDLGSETLEARFRTEPEAASRLLDQVLDDVVRLQSVADPGRCEAFQRALDAPLFAYKADLFARHSLPLVLGRPATASEGAALARAFAHVAETCARAPRRLAHRDLQSRNLLVAGGRVHWIDLQGALLAPPEYDLVCLLRDSYIEWPEPHVEAALERVRPALPDAPSADAFLHRFALLTLTRKGKDHARFHHVAKTRGEGSAWAAVPTTVRHLKRAASAVAGSHPDLEPLTSWISALPEAGTT